MVRVKRVVWMTLLAAGLIVSAAVAFVPGIGQTHAQTMGPQANQTRLHIRIFDGASRRLLPALVRLRAADGTYLAFGNFADLPGWGQGESAVELGQGSDGLFAFRHGMAVWRGEATLVVGWAWRHRDVPGAAVAESQIPAGVYTLEVTRGPEFDMFTETIDLSPHRGRIELDVHLRRAFVTDNYVSADLHVHHAPQSTDARIDAPGQLKLAAVNGVEVVVATNHAIAVDSQHVARDLWDNDEPPVTALPGVEHEASDAHFGVFPVKESDAVVARPWPLEALLADLHDLPGAPLVISFHPRLGWKAYLDAPYCGLWARKDFSAPPPCPQNFDAIEVVSAWQGCGTKHREMTDSWLALLSYNHVTAALGSSDSHFASAMVPGFPRTWIRVGHSSGGATSARALVSAIRKRHTVASTAPFVTLRSGRASEGDFITNTSAKVAVEVRVRAANWVPVDTVRLLVNGQVVKAWELPKKEGQALDFQVTERLRLGSEDVFITAETDSRVPLPPGVTGEYNALPEYGVSRCPPRPGEAPGMPAYAVTSPLFVDRTGDRRFRGFRAQADISL